MKIRLLLCFALAMLSSWGKAESVAIDELGALDLKFTSVEATNYYHGQPLAAKVSFRPGEAISLVTPHRVQQISYLVAQGALVAEQQPIAVLSGPEIHHFMTQFDYTEQRLEVAKRRFDSNRHLYEKRSIDEAHWIGISEAYYSLKLEHEHMRHFRELLREDDGASDSLTLLSPGSGTLVYNIATPGVDQNEEVALVIPENVQRLQMAVPLRRRDGLVAVESGNCRYDIESVSGIAENFFVQAWSKPLDKSCKLLLGQRLMVTPIFDRKGFRIPRTAVFQWQGEPAILLRQLQNLVVFRVQILSNQGQHYTVSCSSDLEGGDVLSSSVSAVQGVLIGLGGD